MNVELMREVGKSILREFQSFDMDYFYQVSSDTDRYCSTYCCFAGRYLLDHTDYYKDGNTYNPYKDEKPGEAKAARLGLDMPNSRLFYCSQWPINLAEPHQKGLIAGSLEYAEYFVNVVLEDYIKTDGWAGNW